jgi:hypothetical protein
MEPLRGSPKIFLLCEMFLTTEILQIWNPYGIPPWIDLYRGQKREATSKNIGDSGITVTQVRVP